MNNSTPSSPLTSMFASSAPVDQATGTHLAAALDATTGPDATVHNIERMFEYGSSDRAGDGAQSEESAGCTSGTETGWRSSTRATTGPISPNRSRRGPGSLGVLMPTLLPARPTFTGRGTGDLGSLTHGLIGSHIQFVTGGEEPSDLLARMYAVAYAVIDANPNATRVLATEAASLAFRYLTEFPPAPPWRLLAVEYDTGSGPVDLAWVHEATGEVFFDEVKTSRVSSGRQVPPTWVAQARRYAAAGSVRFSGSFLGVRLVPLMSADTTRLVRDREPVAGLSPTPVAPLRRSVPGGGVR